MNNSYNMIFFLFVQETPNANGGRDTKANVEHNAENESAIITSIT